MIKKISFYHSLIFFNFCIILSAFSFLRNNSLIILCLFLILTLGISHGSLDNVKGKKLIKFLNIKSMSTFYIGYSLMSLSIIIIWIIFPKSLLIIFLIVAAYHFGKEDTIFLKKEEKIYDNILYLLKGSVVITSPLLFHKIETILIFQHLNFNITGIIYIENIFLYILLILSFFSIFFFFSKKNMELNSLLLIDFFSVLILNYFLNPLVAFTVYFCFLDTQELVEITKYIFSDKKEQIQKTFEFFHQKKIRVLDCILQISSLDSNPKNIGY